MYIARLLGIFVIVGAAIGEVCHNCSKHGPLAVNLSLLGEPNKIIDTGVAAAASPPVPETSLPRLQPAPDALWNQCKRKGCTLTWAMRANDQEVGPYYSPQRNTAASPYQNRDDLFRWGWVEYPSELINPEYHEFYEIWGIGWALDDLGVNALSDVYEGGDNVVIFVDHEMSPPEDVSDDELDDWYAEDQTYEVDGEDYRHTGASYGFSINAIDGVIIAMNRKSPKYAAHEKEPPVPEEGLPELSQFSDVAWIKWKERVQAEAERGGSITGLNYFFSVSIENTETNSVLLRALTANNVALSAWPGMTWEDGTDEMKAILGTPNIQGLAYFLVQHKADLGNMYIHKVQVFLSETWHPCILAHIRQPSDEPGEVTKRDGRKHMVRVHFMGANL